MQNDDLSVPHSFCMKARGFPEIEPGNRRHIDCTNLYPIEDLQRFGRLHHLNANHSWTIACKTSGPVLLTALTKFVNLVLGGGCPLSVCSTFFGARLIAIDKKAGGFRPIAVGYTLRRLVAKCANNYAQVKLFDYLSPIQLGVGVSGGCEAAIHATRRFLSNLSIDSAVVKLDFSNATELAMSL